MEGIAAISAEDFDKQAYRESLEARLGMSYSVMREYSIRSKGERRKSSSLKATMRRSSGLQHNVLSKISVSQFCWQCESIREKMAELNIELIVRLLIQDTMIEELEITI